MKDFAIELEATARAISCFEPVTLVVDPRDEDDARSRLGGEVELLVVPVDNCWLRDNGPIFVRNGSGDVAGVHFGFNGWGGRYPCGKTQEMPRLVVEHFGFHCYRTPFICEGGGISVDGEGTLITTEQVMRNDNRYHGMSRDHIEAMLRDHLGITRVIWLGLGLVEDIETDGHVDNVVEFIEPGRVLVQVVSERSTRTMRSCRRTCGVSRKRPMRRDGHWKSSRCRFCLTSNTPRSITSFPIRTRMSATTPSSRTGGPTAR